MKKTNHSSRFNQVPNKSINALINEIKSRLLIVFSLLIVVNITVAQQRQPDRGFQAANSYASSGFDAVNVSNGNVVINLPIASLPAGRGTSPGFGITLQYNSKLWDSKQTAYSNRLQNTNGDLNDESMLYYYTANNLEMSERSGWKMLTNYRLIQTNRLNLESPNPCLDGESVDKRAAIWKLEMEFPDGSIKHFVPVYLSTVNLDGYYNIDMNGARRIASTQTHPGNGLCYLYQNTTQATTGGMNYMTTDGSRLRLFIPYQSNNWKMYAPDGTVVENGPPDDPTVNQRISNRNGGKVEIKGNLIVDQLGRSITIDGNAITVKGVGGENLTTQIVFGSRWINRRYQAIEASQMVPTGTERYAEMNAEIPTVEQIILPTQAGGQTYLFEYYADAARKYGTDYTDGWGELKSVTLPTGAKSIYTYDERNGTEYKASDILERKAITRALTFTEKYDGVETPRTETTSYDTTLFSGGVLQPNGAYSSEAFIDHSGIQLWDSGMTYRSNSSDGSFTEYIRKYNLPFYTGNPYPYAGTSAQSIPDNGNAYIKTEFTTLRDATGQPSLTAIKDYDYDKNGNVLEIREYDFVPYSSVPRDGSGANKPTGLPGNINSYLKRKTVNTYYNQTPSADSTTSSPYTYENPTAPKLKNVIKSTEIQNAAGTPVSRSEFFYDDPDNKGNLIETRTWDSNKNGVNQPYSNPLMTSNSLSGTVQYDTYGNPTLTTDAKGNQTQITYGNITTPTGTVSGLYPTEAKSAYNTAIQQTVQTEYDFSTGLAKKVTALGNTTAENVVSETEYDAIGRPLKVKTAVNTPLEAWTQSEYDDVNRRVIVRSDLFAKGDGKKIGIQHFDQLGRVRLTRTIEDVATQNPYNEADGIKVQTRYLTGNPNSYQVSSNPYRAATATAATGEESMGWTRSLAVNTGRHAETETFTGTSLPSPWGNNTSSTGRVQTDIDGNATTVTDQANKPRRSITNALGQLIRVDEPDTAGNLGAINAPNQPTNYAYDTLSNLTTVSQGSQTRTFVYDSLSRLKNATNPESGLMQYSYDNNGNLTQKIDARNVQTNYTYDALNRVLTRSYAGEPTGQTTPTVSYFYDNLTNAKGKLIKVSSAISTTEYTSFDILGRVLSHKQTTDGNAYTTSYTYNLSGALIEETYPSGRVVKNTLDADGDLQQVQSRKANDTFRNYANSFNYTAAGAVSSLRLGNGKWETTSFNSRLQPIQIGLGSSATNQGLLKLNYDYGTTDNNGNVKSQTITVPTVGNNTGFTAIQTYTYDSLNRLKDAKEMIGTTQTWKQTFTFDRYGNRNFDVANTTTLGSCPTNQCNPTVNVSNNRFNSGQGYTYDLAGNIITDAQGRTFTYDGENKQKEVKDVNNVSIGQYFYDGDGKRVKKFIYNTQETTIFVYDASGKMVAEYATTVSQTPQVSYLTNDHLGSPRITTNANGQVYSRRDFMPFGEEITSATTAQRSVSLNYGEDGIKQKFTSYERDSETNLDFAQARYFNFGFGRFSSPDDFLNDTSVYAPQSWNLYAYVRNNPLKYTDPNGEEVYGDKLTEDQRKALIADWQAKTGYKKIYFDKDNGYKLTIDTKAGFDSKLNGKNTSGTARTELLAAATSDIRKINLEAVSSTDVGFARHLGKTEGTFKTSDGRLGEIRTVQVDFKDFDNLQGDADVKESFSLGITVLHEFEHALHNNDATGKDSYEKGGNGAGPLEDTYINPIRRELGLPERVSYGGFAITGASLPAPHSKSDRGVFFKTTDGTKKILSWQKNVVGGKGL